MKCIKCGGAGSAEHVRCLACHGTGESRDRCACGHLAITIHNERPLCRECADIEVELMSAYKLTDLAPALRARVEQAIGTAPDGTSEPMIKPISKRRALCKSSGGETK